MAQLLNNARTAFAELWADAVWEEWASALPSSVAPTDPAPAAMDRGLPR